ncbi:MAG TPA: sugar transferase [Steroidobacteraceae bacterium]|jgi:lipopolysaccharide/colanic/teichoic acid biosynthesis glycosyltransferase
MPTNYRAQVKMTPKQELRDAVVIAPLRDDPVVERASTPLRGRQLVRQLAPIEAKNEPFEHSDTPRWSQSRGARMRSLGYALSKRAFDLILGSILLVIAVPIILVAAVAIRVNTPGSPFFVQTRLGTNGKPFKIFKLRGMYIDARTRFPTYYDYSAKQDLEFCFHHEEDPRVTRAGRFIRKTSIDELPNLWNVVLGDMSLVGPRPEIPEVLALYGQHRDEYLSVKPGVTCLSKVTGRDRLTKRETIEFDLDYIRRRTFSLDWKILWRTFRSVALRRDVF